MSLPIESGREVIAVATGQSNSKGNGASKRMANPRHKATRERCWERGQKRKAHRREVAAQRHEANLTAGITPWEQARLDRRAKRAAGFEQRHAAFHKRTGLSVPSDGCTVCVKTQNEGTAA